MILCLGESPGDRATCFSSWLCIRTIGLLGAAVWDLKLGVRHSATDDSSRGDSCCGFGVIDASI